MARSIRDTNPISYRDIAPPAWLRIDTDELEDEPFRGGQHLPEVFYLGDAYRCSCGSRALGISPAISDLLVFTSTTAILKRIQTTYCVLCRYTRGRVGPDLREFGLFNWNNKYAFSHELMNNYTAQFTTSITPFFAFHQTIVNTYLCEQSPEPFPSLYLFCSAWFGFIRLQQLETNMQCSLCGPNPRTVIADGVSISFPRHRVANLRPPTWRDKIAALVRSPRHQGAQTCFLGLPRVRLQFQRVLEMAVRDGIEPLQAAMNEHEVSFVHYCSLMFL